MLAKKAKDFADEHGYDDRGSVSFGRGSRADACLVYLNDLLELQEEVRSMLPAPPTLNASKGEQS